MLIRRISPYASESPRDLPLMVTNLHDEMDRVFASFFEPTFRSCDVKNGAARISSWIPALDVSETDGHLTVRAEVPGVDPAKIDVKVHGDVLTISGSKDDTHEEKGKNFHRSERVFGSFFRQVTLPEAVDSEKVQAEVKNGVLIVNLAKRQGATARKIPVVAKA